MFAYSSGDLMVYRTRPRFVQVFAILLTFSAVGCFGGATPRVMRNGEDMLMVGGAPFVRALDSVPGDAILMGGDVNFEGSAGGDYLGAGGSQKIGGHVHGSIRSAGGEIHASGAVDRNATIAGGNVSLDSSAVIGGNAYITGGSVTVGGAVRGSLMASGGEVTINGPVGRDVEVTAGALHLGSRAQISGNLRYRVSKNKVTIDPGAKVAGATIVLPPKQGNGTLGVLWLMGVVIAGIVVVALFPRFTTQSAETLYQRPARSALIGLAWACLVPIGVVIAAVTFIGIPLALVAVATWLTVLLIANVPVALWIGKKLLGARAATGRNGAILSVLVGGLILVVVGLVPVIGTLIALAAAVVGAGAIVLRATAHSTAQADYAI